MNKTQSNQPTNMNELLERLVDRIENLSRDLGKEIQANLEGARLLNTAEDAVREANRQITALKNPTLLAAPVAVNETRVRFQDIPTIVQLVIDWPNEKIRVIKEVRQLTHL